MLGFNGFWTKKTAIAIGLGQFVSLLITSTSFTSSELSRKGINAPTSQSFANYVLLAVVYGGLVVYRKKPLQKKWFRKFVGVGVCVAGLVMVILSDVHASDRASGSNPVKGDLLVIGGSMLYAVSNVSEEFLVKAADRIELMAMLGAFGAIVSACQISILERAELKSIHWTSSAVLPFIGFAMAMFLFYSLVPVLLKISGSTMLNLSLLTSDMWAVLIRIFAYHEKVDWMYFIAFGAVAVGLMIYSGGEKEEAAEKAAQVSADNVMDEEEKDEETGLGAAARMWRIGDGKVDETVTVADK